MDNADLDKLRVSPGRLVPKFSSNVTNYNVTLGSEITETKLTIITSDSGASTSVKGNDLSGKVVQLKEGKTSVIEILVTAEDGQTTKSYLLSIHRLSPDDAFLSQLDVSVGDLQPNFTPSTHTYYCDLPSNVSQIAIKAKAEDPKIKISNKGGAPLGAIPLSAGLSVIEVTVTSPNGCNTSTYTINALRLPSPYIFQLQSTSFQCAVCSNIPHCPCKVSSNNNGDIYCRECLVQLSRVNKLDPMTSKPLGEAWLVLDQETGSKISDQKAVCSTPFGKLEGKVAELPSVISQKHKENDTQNTVSCSDCSKKVPGQLIDLHKQISCSSKICEAPFKSEVKQFPWEKMIVDESLPADLDKLLTQAELAEEKYLNCLKDQDPSTWSGADILGLLRKAGSCYATAVRVSPKDPRGHVGMGVVMEEIFYVQDMYGVKDEESSSDDAESEAEISSKDEEFLAICKLHGVLETATIALQLRAVEAEYRSLQQAGQTHKAEHVQQLYQWKSKKALEASKGSYSVDTESPLYRARVKYEHAVSVKPTDHQACYHLGRICLLLGDIAMAEKCLIASASIKPSHSETLFCLGIALAQSNANQAKPLLAHGIETYLSVRQEISVGYRCAHLQSFQANEFWRPTNTLIGESLLSLGKLGGHSFMDERSCYKIAANLFSLTPGLQKGSTVQHLLWLLIRSRAALAGNDMKNKSLVAATMCRQVSSLISHCQLSPTEQLRDLQMKVFEDGVLLEPSNSVALMRLGNGQFQQYEATGDKAWLDIAEQTLRASIGCEGKQDNDDQPPKEISEQAWWKKRKEVTSKPASGATPTGTTPTTKQSTSKAPIKPIANKAPPTKQPAGMRGGVKPAPAVGRGRGGAQTTGGARGKGVATLGELKTNNPKKPTVTPTNKQQQQKDPPKTEVAAKQQNTTPVAKTEQTDKISAAPDKPVKLNATSYHPRLGLARVLAKQESKREESIALYNEVIKMDPSIHDAYIELGELLAPADPVAAVAIYSKFPFSDPPSFDDAYLHGEIVRLLMSSASYDDPQLVTSMIAVGKALGIGVLDKNVAVLEAKFKTKVLKKVYAGVHGKDIDNPELQAFFKFKCWT